MSDRSRTAGSLGLSREGQRRSGWWYAGTMVFVAAFGCYAWGEIADDKGTMSGFVVVPVLCLLAMPLLRLERKRTQAFDGAGIVFTALAVRCVGAFARLYVIEDVYSGVADSAEYDTYGRLFADSFRRFQFDVDPGRPIPGTGFARVLTGIVYVFVGSNRFAGFLVFGFFAFLGTYLLYRAFVIAVPDGDHRRYALLIFFWPSLVFWPSSIGKEAWMLLGIGLASWGLARVITRGRFGYVAFAAGVLGLYLVRPHVALLIVGGAVVAVLMGLLFRSGDSVKSFGFASKFSAAAVVLVLAAILAPRVADFFEISDLGRDSIEVALTETTEQTGQGGSSFDSVQVGSVLDYPWALVTVLFRPFPNEASNAQSVISAGEGIMLILLLLGSFRAVFRLPRTAVKQPYIAYATAYILAFAYAFASIANFGILVRQRIQVIPLVFLFVALPLSRRSHRLRAVSPEGTPPSRPAAQVVQRPRPNIVKAGIGPPSGR